nr:MAG TPA: hypothetical protein [Caudoviricetes sp.]DAO66332.1 MAG TPA: hypothetical protein [Caudoviricetes sp.]
MENHRRLFPCLIDILARRKTSMLGIYHIVKKLSTERSEIWHRKS